jgi:Fe-S-cluster containining protein
MPEVNIDKKTRWECQRCGACCHDFILDRGKLISIIKEKTEVCRFFDNESKLCKNYKERPYICRTYPFVPDLNKILDLGGIAHPLNAFKLENLKIHTECKGYGEGKRIIANKRLMEQIKEMAYGFAIRFKKCHENGGDVEDII